MSKYRQIIARTSAKIYAAAALLYGLLWMYIYAWSVTYYQTFDVSHVPAGLWIALFLLPGLICASLAIFIWRERTWAMITALVSSLVPHLPSLLHDLLVRRELLLSPPNIPILAVSAAFGLLTALHLVGRQRTPHSGAPLA